MSALNQTVSGTLATYYEMIRKRVHELVDPLPQDKIWRRPYYYGNSVGNLLLHLTGNLNYYIGAQIANTGYVRQRDREFSDTGKPKQELLRNFDQAIDLVIKTIKNQSAGDWTAPYLAEREPESRDRFTVLFRCAAHAYHHVGQMIYLQKELTHSGAHGSE
jgi:uncharacterized damage-inducible protein DinB